MNIEIRPITEADLPILNDKVRASFGRPHARELRDQALGLLTFYVVWMNDEPIGHGFVNWSGPRDDEVRIAYPNCPEIYRVGINQNTQSQGFGTQLVYECEREAISRGFQQIGLGVAHENPRAESLYRRLGYASSSIQHYMDEYQAQANDGTLKTFRDPLRFLIKELH